MRPTPGDISPHAAVEGTVGAGSTVAAFAVVAASASVGRDCTIGPHAVVLEQALVGDGCVLHPHTVIGEHVQLGDRVEVMAGAVIGREPKGAGSTARHPKFDHRLCIADGCSIGAHATIYYDVEVGEGTLIGDCASIREGGRIGARCIISRCVTLNYDVYVGDGVKIMDSTHVTGGTWIGNGAFVSTMVAMVNDNAPTTQLELGRLAGPRIEPGAVIGAGAILLPGVVVGARARVGAGAVVTRDVAAGATVFGVPARARAQVSSHPR